MGIPAGGLIARLSADAITATFAERWVATWAVAGFSRRRTVAAVLRRALPSVLSQIGLILIGLTGGAVAVEQVFAIPGRGRATLGTASSQDIPALQADILNLLAVAVIVGAAVGLGRRLLLGPALRLGSLSVPDARLASRLRDLTVPVVSAVLLAVIVIAGVFRDPFTSARQRLQPPSWVLPFGVDANGRDLLGRVGHGAVTALGGGPARGARLLGGRHRRPALPERLDRPARGHQRAPPILAGIIVTALWGPSIEGAALAVALVS